MFDPVRVLGEQRNHKSGGPRSLSARSQAQSAFVPEPGIGASWLAPGLAITMLAVDFSRRKESSSSGVEQALDRLRPLLRFLFCSHELRRPSQ